MRSSLALSMLVTLSCAGAPSSPSETARAYAAALREGRTIDAWRLLSRSAREGVTFERFEETLRAQPAEVRAMAERFEAVSGDEGATARLALPEGEVLTLRSEAGRWRLDPSALDFYAQHTPRQTLRAFVQAYRRGRWDVLLGLATDGVRRRIEAIASRVEDGGAPRSAVEVLRESWSGEQADQVAQRVDALAQALERGHPIEVLGERATMTYGVGARLIARLVREDGRWHIERTD